MRHVVVPLRAWLQYYMYYGDECTVECPKGSGCYMNLYQVAEEIARRFVGDLLARPGRPATVFGAAGKFQEGSALARLRAVLRVLPR